MLTCRTGCLCLDPILSPNPLVDWILNLNLIVLYSLALLVSGGGRAYGCTSDNLSNAVPYTCDRGLTLGTSKPPSSAKEYPHAKQWVATYSVMKPAFAQVSQSLGAKNLCIANARGITVVVLFSSVTTSSRDSHTLVLPPTFDGL